MNLQLVREPLSVDAFNELSRTVGWKYVAPANYNLAVANSVACVSAFIDTRAVGGGRLVGDVGMYLYIQDVIVHRDLHGLGIGSRILQELHHVIEELDCRRDKVGLNAAVDICDFYVKLGYVESPQLSKYLVKTIAKHS